MSDIQMSERVNAPAPPPDNTMATVHPFARGVQLGTSRGADCRITKDPTDWEVAVARATLHVVAAYRSLDQVEPDALPQWLVPLFCAVCEYLSSTVLAMDELTLNAWPSGSH